MESGSPIDDQNLIDNVGSVEDFVSSLAQHGCSDLTQLVDQESCNELPATGGGLWDAYRGVINDDNGKEEVLKRAARELYRWSRLKHPNINPLMGTAIFRGRMATVTQYTDNGSLMSYINANPNVDRIDLCIDICAGLKYLHENDMVHGDLKAAHVVVSHDGAAVITDLGSSQLKDLALKFTDMTNISFSLRWTAPELFDEVGGAHTSKKVDIYAYGMEVLTGKIPYEGLSEHQVLFKVTVKHEAPTRPTVGVNDEMWQLLQECWKWEQSERPDMLAVAERLLSSLASSVKEAIALVDSKPGQLRVSGLDPLVPIFPSIASLQKTSVKCDTEQPEISLSKLARFGNPNQLAAAEFLKTKLLAAQRRLLGQDHPHTLQSMANLARAYCDQRRLVEAESLLVEALAKQKQILGNDHIDTQRSLGYLAMVYCDQKRAGEAEPLALEALAAQKKILGADHLDTLETMLTLSGVYDRQKRFGKAAKLMVKAIAAQKRILGANHPETVRNITGLAMTYDSSKRSADAESLLVDAVAIQKELLTIEHAHTLQTMVLLAKVYDDRNRLAEAERLLVEAVATRRRVLGDHHIDTLDTMGCLALFYCRRGRSADSQSLLNELLAARKYFEGHAAMDDSALMEALTMTHLQQGQQGKAGSVMAELVAGQKESLGNDRPKTLTQGAILAGLYFNQGEIRQAESSFVEVIAAQKRVLGDEHPETLMSQAALSNVYLAQGRRYEAVALRFSTLASQRRVLGDAHPETIRSGVELEAMLPSGS